MRGQVRPGFRVSYNDDGEPDAEALVMISGAGGSKDGWGLLAPALSERYRLVCVDCRGLGESDPGAEPVSFEAAADDIAGLLDVLGVRRAHVLGWSWGSSVAQHFALRHPARLGSLVLWSTWPRTDGYLRAVFTGLRYPFAHKDMETAVTVLGTVFSPELLDAPEYELVLAGLLPLVPQTDTQVRTVVEQWDAGLLHDVSARLPEITAPTLVVVGEQDVLTPPRYAREVAELVPGARFELFTGPGASHAVGLERPEEFAALLLDFLAEAPA
jgi:pimeloyl-ACP methyl ester carboxylesterase